MPSKRKKVLVGRPALQRLQLGDISSGQESEGETQRQEEVRKTNEHTNIEEAKEDPGPAHSSKGILLASDLQSEESHFDFEKHHIRKAGEVKDYGIDEFEAVVDEDLLQLQEKANPSSFWDEAVLAENPTLPGRPDNGQHWTINGETSSRNLEVVPTSPPHGPLRASPSPSPNPSLRHGILPSSTSSTPPQPSSNLPRSVPKAPTSPAKDIIRTDSVSETVGAATVGWTSPTVRQPQPGSRIDQPGSTSNGSPRIDTYTNPSPPVPTQAPATSTQQTTNPSRPLSHPSQHSSFGPRLQLSPQRPSTRTGRRASLYSVGSNRPTSFGTDVPLPHQPQAHFFGAPDPDLRLGSAGPQPGTVVPGDYGYHCGFDSFSSCGDGPSMVAENALLVGFSGGLDVYKVDSERIDSVGGLRGLAGAVIGAKILPWTFRDDAFASIRPLVALILHRPIVHPDQSDGTDYSDASEAVYSEDSRSPSPLPAGERNSANKHSAPSTTQYQTTVEVYSLKTGQRLSILFQSEPVSLLPVSAGYSEPNSNVQSVPPPTGHLKLDAQGKFIIVASGTTGEIFVFSSFFSSTDLEHAMFRCIGKFWTTINHQATESILTSTTHPSASPRLEHPTSAGVPLFSLSHRWLATTPPSTSPASSFASLNGTVPLSDPNRKPPGYVTHVAPPQPILNCAIEASEDAGLINRVMRGVTQEAIRGAKWIGDHSALAWKHYWNKATSDTGQANPNNLTSSPSSQNQTPYFPPTHGHATSPGSAALPTSEPTLVSIYDLQRLLDAEEVKIKNADSPLATFAPPQGCSAMSFSPTGLWLMTVSRRGDCQSVWDLMRIRPGRPQYLTGGIGSPAAMTSPKLATAALHTSPSSSPPAASSGLSAGTIGNTVANSSPVVRQVAYFTRLTVANVVDIIWLPPRGDRVAILTENLTLHMFELPSKAFQWPPPSPSVKKKKKKPQQYQQQEEQGRQNYSSNFSAHTPPNAALVHTEIGPPTDPLSTTGKQKEKFTAGAFAALTSTLQAINDSARPLIAATGRTRRAESTGEAHTQSSKPVIPQNSTSSPAGGSNRISGGLAGLAGYGINSSATVGAKGGKMVAATLTRSLGAASSAASSSVRSIRQASDNKLHLLPLLAGAGSPGTDKSNTGTGSDASNSVIVAPANSRVRWMTGRDRGSIAVCIKGILRIYTVRRSRIDSGPQASGHGGAGMSGEADNGGIRLIVSKSWPVEFALPNVSDAILKSGPAATQAHARWSLRTPASYGESLRRTSPARPHDYLSFAEIDSNPPYTAVHVDPRVTLVAYSDASSAGEDLSTNANSKRWIFGQDIPGRRLFVGHQAHDSNWDRDRGRRERIEQYMDESPPTQILTAQPQEERVRGARQGVGGSRRGFNDTGAIETEYEVLDAQADVL